MTSNCSSTLTTSTLSSRPLVLEPVDPMTTILSIKDMIDAYFLKKGTPISVHHLMSLQDMVKESYDMYPTPSTYVHPHLLTVPNIVRVVNMFVNRLHETMVTDRYRYRIAILLAFDLVLLLDPSSFKPNPSKYNQMVNCFRDYFIYVPAFTNIAQYYRLDVMGCAKHAFRMVMIGHSSPSMLITKVISKNNPLLIHLKMLFESLKSTEFCRQLAGDNITNFAERWTRLEFVILIGFSEAYNHNRGIYESSLSNRVPFDSVSSPVDLSPIAQSLLSLNNGSVGKTSP